MLLDQTPVGRARVYGPEHWKGAQERDSLNLWSAEWHLYFK